MGSFWSLWDKMLHEHKYTAQLRLLNGSELEPSFTRGARQWAVFRTRERDTQELAPPVQAFG